MKTCRHMTLLIAISLVSLPTSASWLALCKDTASGTDGRRYLSPDGGQTTLVVADAPMDGCRQVEIPVSAAAIRWAGLKGYRGIMNIPLL